MKTTASLVLLTGLATISLAEEIKRPVLPAPVAPQAAEDPVVKKTRALVESGKAMTAESFAGLVKSPKPDALKLPSPATKPLSGREVASRAAGAYVRAGWVYQCTKCTRWHTNLAGGYAIAGDAVVTAHHVMQPPAAMAAGKGYPVVVRGEEELLPLASVVADDETGDTIILRLSASVLKPLALTTETQIGDSAWCLSDPRGVRGFFSHGIVNRFYARSSKEGKDARLRRINVSTDWAPGSSGSAVLDDQGNAIGHVARIQPLTTGGNASSDGHDKTPPSAVMTLNEAVPAAVVLDLLRKSGAVK